MTVEQIFRLINTLTWCEEIEKMPDEASFIDIDPKTALSIARQLTIEKEDDNLSNNDCQ